MSGGGSPSELPDAGDSARTAERMGRPPKKSDRVNETTVHLGRKTCRATESPTTPIFGRTGGE